MSYEKKKLHDDELLSYAAEAVKLTGAEPVNLKIARAKNDIVFDVYMNVPYGCSIPELAFDCQEAVKKKIETEEICVHKINIHIQGVI